jgi:quercetin 2,3-dioxygenase
MANVYSSKRDKMVKPRYQDISSSKIPIVKTEDQSVQLKVIAGEAQGAQAIIDTRADTRTPIMYLHPSGGWLFSWS